MARIAVLGTGKLGRVLARGWAKAGHQVYIGSRSPERAHDLAENISKNALGGSVAQAAAASDIVVPAVPWFAIEETLREAGDVSGRILLDCTNPLARGGRTLTIAHGDSGAEWLARRLPGTTIVKALNTLSARVLERCVLAGRSPSGANALLCGDRAEQNGIVFRLLGDLGLSPLDVGELVQARYLEPLAMLIRDLDEGTPHLDLRFSLAFEEKRAA